MNYNLVFDSYAWVEYILGSSMGKFVQSFLNTAEICYTPSIVISELSTKFERENKHEEWDTFFKFIKKNSSIISLDSKLANQSGKMKIELRKTEKSIGLADAIIYQTAVNLNALVITGDEHFSDFSDVVYLKNTSKIKEFLKKIESNE